MGTKEWYPSLIFGLGIGFSSLVSLKMPFHCLVYGLDTLERLLCLSLLLSYILLILSLRITAANESDYCSPALHFSWQLPFLRCRHGPGRPFDIKSKTGLSVVMTGIWYINL